MVLLKYIWRFGMRVVFMAILAIFLIGSCSYRTDYARLFTGSLDFVRTNFSLNDLKDTVEAANLAKDNLYQVFPSLRDIPGDISRLVVSPELWAEKISEIPEVFADHNLSSVNPLAEPLDALKEIRERELTWGETKKQFTAVVENFGKLKGDSQLIGPSEVRALKEAVDNIKTLQEMNW